MLNMITAAAAQHAWKLVWLGELLLKNEEFSDWLMKAQENRIHKDHWATGLHGGAVPHSKRVPGSIPGWGLSMWSLHVLPLHAWVLSGYSGFLPPSKNMHVRLIGVSKIVLRSECEHVWLFVSFVSVWPWRPVQGVPRLSPPMTAGIGSSPPHDLTDGLSGYRKWMDGCLLMIHGALIFQWLDVPDFTLKCQPQTTSFRNQVLSCSNNSYNLFSVHYIPATQKHLIGYVNFMHFKLCRCLMSETEGSCRCCVLSLCLCVLMKSCTHARTLSHTHAHT